MKYNGKSVVYKYESIEKLLSDLMDSTEDKEIYERGFIRSLRFDIPMEKDDIDKFYEDLKEVHPMLFTYESLKEGEFIGPHSIFFTIKEVEDDLRI